jgi:hypothetical protein
MPRRSTWSVDSRDVGCSRLCRRRVEGVQQRPSPAWMQALLTSAGIRPLGLLVDLTNLVMLELGEPMHAFDARSLAARARRSLCRAGEAAHHPGWQELALAGGDLVIADQRQALALAGIMGGAASMVSPIPPPCCWKPRSSARNASGARASVSASPPTVRRASRRGSTRARTGGDQSRHRPARRALPRQPGHPLLRQPEHRRPERRIHPSRRTR